MKRNQKTRRANTLLSLAALVVVLMSNVYVGRAQLELAWENSHYHYQSFNKYKKIIQAEEGLVDMRTGNVIYKEQENHWFFLTPDGSQLFDGKEMDIQQLSIFMILIHLRNVIQFTILRLTMV